MFKFAVKVGNVKDVYQWLRQNKIRHMPVRKMKGIHYFELFQPEDAVAFKLKWNSELIEKEN